MFGRHSLKRGVLAGAGQPIFEFLSVMTFQEEGLREESRSLIVIF